MGGAHSMHVREEMCKLSLGWNIWRKETTQKT
jgi:hypothetical protein